MTKRRRSRLTNRSLSFTGNCRVLKGQIESGPFCYPPHGSVPGISSIYFPCAQTSPPGLPTMGSPGKSGDVVKLIWIGLIVFSASPLFCADCIPVHEAGQHVGE